MICRAPKCFKTFAPTDIVVAAILKPRIAGRQAALTASMHRACVQTLGLQFYGPVNLSNTRSNTMKNQKPTMKTTAKKTAVAATKKPVLHSMEEHGAKVQAFIGKRKSAPRSEFVAFMRKYAPAVYSTLAKKLEKAGYIVRKAEEVKRGRKMEALAA